MPFDPSAYQRSATAGALRNPNPALQQQLAMRQAAAGRGAINPRAGTAPSPAAPAQGFQPLGGAGGDPWAASRAMAGAQQGMQQPLFGSPGGTPNMQNAMQGQAMSMAGAPGMQRQALGMQDAMQGQAGAAGAGGMFGGPGNSQSAGMFGGPGNQAGPFSQQFNQMQGALGQAGAPQSPYGAMTGAMQNMQMPQQQRPPMQPGVQNMQNAMGQMSQAPSLGGSMLGGAGAAGMQAQTQSNPNWMSPQAGNQAAQSPMQRPV